MIGIELAMINARMLAAGWLSAAVVLSTYGAEVTTTEELVAAVRDGKAGDIIMAAPGVYRLNSPLEVKSGMALRGAGMLKTITNSPQHNRGQFLDRNAIRK